MRFYHTGCGGEIDVKKRQCMRCKRKWNLVSFRLDPVGIRPMVDLGGGLAPSRATASETTKATYSKWADRLPPVITFASKLPRWPRWARVLSTVVFLLVVVLIVWLVRR